MSVEMMDLADVLGMISNDARAVDYPLCRACGSGGTSNEPDCDHDYYHHTYAVSVGDILPSKRLDDGYERIEEDMKRTRCIMRPVIIRDGVMFNGHHRIAAAASVGITEIPVTRWGDDVNWETLPEEYHKDWTY